MAMAASDLIDAVASKWLILSAEEKIAPAAPDVTQITAVATMPIMIA
jgi:hypothetical protein